MKAPNLPTIEGVLIMPVEPFKFTDEENAILRDKIKDFAELMLQGGKLDNLAVEALLMDIEETISEGVEQE
jgi:hypothetical protein